ncbi:hypothetical protein ACEPPN_010556 [Leptodophora sp. 'Broadleaf-Isolate-01']
MDTPGPKFVTLISDIWYMVFNEVQLWVPNLTDNEDYVRRLRAWFQSLRLVSKTFNEIITPLAYWIWTYRLLGHSKHFQVCKELQQIISNNVYSIKKQLALDKLATIVESSRVLEYFGQGFC